MAFSNSPDGNHFAPRLSSRGLGVAFSPESQRECRPGFASLRARRSSCAGSGRDRVMVISRPTWGACEGGGACVSLCKDGKGCVGDRWPFVARRGTFLCFRLLFWNSLSTLRTTYGLFDEYYLLMYSCNNDPLSLGGATTKTNLICCCFFPSMTKFPTPLSPCFSLTCLTSWLPQSSVYHQSKAYLNAVFEHGGWMPPWDGRAVALTAVKMNTCSPL